MLFLYAFAHPLSPLISNETIDSSLLAPGSAEGCTDIENCRTIPAILYGCIAVVFACTWVAIHPNIPRSFDGPGKERKDSFGIHPAVVGTQNILFMMLTLIAPELIILWAMRQWFSARTIAKKYDAYGWTKTHGFFLIMGGFVIYDGDKFVCTLGDDEWDRNDTEMAMTIAKCHGGALNINNDTGHYTMQWYSEPEVIKGKAKSLLDLLIQTNIISVTEDEIMDKSKRDAISKTIMVGQTLWFIVQCIARGIQRLPITNLEILTLAFALLNFATYFLWWNKPQRVHYPIKINMSRRKSKEIGQSKELGIEPRGSRNFSGSFRQGLSEIGQVVASDWKFFSGTFLGPLRVIAYPILTLMNQCSEIIIGTCHYETGLAKDPRRLYISIAFLAVLFGGIHCIPWSFTFPTHREETIWRICALFVTFIPVASVSVARMGRLLDSLPELIGLLCSFVFVLLLPITYIASRVTLIVLALMELRRLPPGAYEAVRWTTFMPHI